MLDSTLFFYLYFFSRLPCMHSVNSATEPLSRPLSFLLCLIRFVPESAQNNGGSNEACHFDARGPSCEPTLATVMLQKRKKTAIAAMHGPHSVFDWSLYGYTLLCWRLAAG